MSKIVIELLQEEILRQNERLQQENERLQQEIERLFAEHDRLLKRLNPPKFGSLKYIRHFSKKDMNNYIKKILNKK